MSKLKYIEGSLIGENFKPGLEFKFQLAIPCVDVENFALLVEHDGQNDANVNSMLRLADEGKAPYCVSVGVLPGTLLLPGGTQRGMRPNSYDLFDREYGDFLVYELIPYIEKTYDINFSKSPDMHFVSGGSSGGISAFVIAWFHPDYFHRVYMSSPSFLAMGRGNEIPYLIRKYETKPFRVYEEFSENEPNSYFGWSKSIDEEAREALMFANYDFKHKFFPNEGHVGRYKDENEAYIRNEWIWEGWNTTEITVRAHSERVDKVIPFGSKWEKCEQFPETKKPACAELSQSYKHIVLSNDEKMWYVGNDNEDIVYAIVKNDEIQSDKALIHATLHTIPCYNTKGAIDMAVDKTDRLFVLTEIGIQCVQSFGLIDVILDLPDNTKPEKIAITDALYVQMRNGVYKRQLCQECVTDGEEKRKKSNITINLT